MMRHMIRAFAFVAAMFVAASAGAQGRIEELMRKSGLWDQAAQMRLQMKAGVAEARAQARAKQQEMLSDEQYAQLQAGIDRAFAPDILRETMTLNMEELVQPADQEAVLKWLSSDLGTRFTRWEVLAGSVDEIRKAETEAPRLLKALSPARLDKYRRLASALDAGNTIATLTINLTTAIVYGIGLVMPDTDADGAARGIRQRMSTRRDEMAKFYAERALQTYSYVYRHASDAQMEEYVRFAESAPARRYHDAGIKAIDNTISQAALALGRDLGTAMRERRNKS
jgi:hypothetical protein